MSSLHRHPRDDNDNTHLLFLAATAPLARIRGCWSHENGLGFFLRQVHTITPAEVGEVSNDRYFWSQ